MGEVALAWSMAQPGITAPIIGGTKPKYLDEAVSALTLKLTEEEIKEISSLYVPKAIVRSVPLPDRVTCDPS